MTHSLLSLFSGNGASQEFLYALRKRDRLRSELSEDIHQLKSLVGLEDEQRPAQEEPQFIPVTPTSRTSKMTEIDNHQVSHINRQSRLGAKFLLPLIGGIVIGAYALYKVNKLTSERTKTQPHEFKLFANTAKPELSGVKHLLSNAFLQQFEVFAPALISVLLEKGIEAVTRAVSPKLKEQTSEKYNS